MQARRPFTFHEINFIEKLLFEPDVNKL